MEHRTPEQLGISSRHVLAFYKELESQQLSTHAVILSRGNAFFSECYWEPFHKDFKHRMYSVTKSFVSIAIGFCQQDGLLQLSDPLEKFFPEYEKEFHHSSTILEMLQMTTSLDKSGGWFTSGCDDRVAFYFQKAAQKNPDTLFAYDSVGSFML
ncbi:MAG: serine hydrolase, partial [Oscillospiraceae bacterium]|nr:serine hydrolase [Oscillospiraceae bacterium]